ncbi:hypothetical protein OSB04_024581 [Centaurea solstitialis]|uniref:Uncharacterized protein n=1 Tax=Centaurea solstitialis TaxID=347529 RepID=A0AA38SLF5_9ASTR|nr:hypothetical protein OSB04_024581 [Centaurea solstitialis]
MEVTMMLNKQFPLKNFGLGSDANQGSYENILSYFAKGGATTKLRKQAKLCEEERSLRTITSLQAYIRNGTPQASPSISQSVLRLKEEWFNRNKIASVSLSRKPCARKET